MLVILSERIHVSNNEQFVNVLVPIFPTTLLGIVIVVNFEHLKNAPIPILVTELGIIILCNDEHESKVLLEIRVKLFERVHVTNEVHE
jgi:hypothetical protein